MTVDSLLFTPNIAAYLSILLNNSKLGISEEKPALSDITTGYPHLEDHSADRFKLSLPYCREMLKWEVIFSQQSATPPDFIFGTDQQFFYPDLDKLESYLHWDATNLSSLQLLLRELLVQYKEQHLALLADKRLEFEYNSLVESAVDSDDVEVYVTRHSDGRLGPVKFFIRLRMEFANIPDYLVKNATGCQFSELLVEYQSVDGGRVTTQVFLSSKLQQLLGPFNISIPTFPEEGCLMDYVPRLKEFLQSLVSQISKSYEKRKLYISSFLKMLGGAVLEFDSEAFQRISFLFCWKEFHFIIIVDLSQKFPTEQPSITFQSIYHEKQNGIPYSKSVKTYPYSPRWTSTEMVERARSYILDSIESFQKESIRDGALRQ